MGFSQKYVKREIEENRRKLPKKDKSILPFFGFTFTEDSSTEYRRSGGGYSLEDAGYGTYEIKRNPTYLDSKRYESAGYFRSYTPRGKEKELEDKIYAILSRMYKSSYSTSDNLFEEFDPFKTPYLRKSAKQYYTEKANDKLTKIIATVVKLLVFACVVAGLCLAYFKTDIWLLYSLGVGLVIFVVGALITGTRHEKYLEEHPYSELSPEEEEEWRQKYLKSISVGDKECDALLREYACLKGYDRK